jgi:hypothetical protein
MKYRKDAKNDQVVPQSHLVCACAKYMHKREWMFEKMKMLRTKVRGSPQRWRMWKRNSNRREKKGGEKEEKSWELHIRWEQQQTRHGNYNDVRDWGSNDLP